MTNVLRVTCAIVAACLWPGHSYADGPGWIYNRTVVSIVNTANGGFNVRVNPDLTGCVAQSGYNTSFASVYPSHPGIARLKADILVAFVTGKQISLYLNDNTCTVIETVLGPY